MDKQAPQDRGETAARRGPARLVSLRTELLRLVLLAALPIIALTGALIYQLLDSQRAATGEYLLQTARAASLTVDREMTAVEAMAQTLAHSPLLENGDLERFYREAARVASTSGHLRVALMSPEGEQLFNTALPFGSPLPNVMRPLATDQAGANPTQGLRMVETATRWRQLFETGQPHYSDLYRGLVTSTPSISFRWPVLQDGEVRYGLALAISSQRLSALLADYQVPHGTVLAVIDRLGAIIARGSDAGLFVGQQSSESVRNNLNAPDGVLTRGETADGIVVVQATQTSAQTGWTVAVGAPMSLMEAGLRRSLLFWVLGVVVLLMLAGFSARKTWHEVGVPLQQMAGYADALSRGQTVTPPQTQVLEVAECGRAWSMAMQAEAARRAQERLRISADARREQSEEVAREKDRVLAVLGHELRNPIAAISNAVGVMESLPSADGRSNAMIRLIGRQIRHLSRLLDDMLDMTRATFGKMVLVREPVDLTRLAERAQEHYALRDGIAPLQVFAEPVWVEGDRTRLDQVLRNLIDNAVRFTPMSGRITLRIRAQDGQAMIEVQDSGTGMSPSEREIAFSAFRQGGQTVGQNAGGLGLGLALVRQIVQLHGGQVTLDEGDKAQGLVVRVQLPLRDWPEQSPPADTSPGIDTQPGDWTRDGLAAIDSPRAGGSPPDHEPVSVTPSPGVSAMTAATRNDDGATAAEQRVLIVEDQDDVRASLFELVHAMGRSVDAVATGHDALVRMHEFPVDIMLIDIGLPDMTGFALAAQIRQAQPPRTVSLIALTGFSEPHDRERALAAGFDQFMLKPVSRQMLQAVLAPNGGCRSAG